MFSMNPCTMMSMEEAEHQMHIPATDSSRDEKDLRLLWLLPIKPARI